MKFLKNIPPIRLIVITAAVFISLVILGAVLAILHHRNQPNYTVNYTDKDTGNVVSVQPNTTPEKYNSGDQVTVLGADSVYTIGSMGLTSSQLPLLTQDLASNAVKKLPTHDDTLKIINTSYDFNSQQLSADLLYKAGVAPGHIKFTINNAYNFTYQITVSRKLVYRSDPLLVISNPDDYGGDGSPPESQ